MKTRYLKISYNNWVQVKILAWIPEWGQCSYGWAFLKWNLSCDGSQHETFLVFLLLLKLKILISKNANWKNISSIILPSLLLTNKIFSEMSWDYPVTFSYFKILLLWGLRNITMSWLDACLAHCRLEFYPQITPFEILGFRCPLLWLHPMAIH